MLTVTHKHIPQYFQTKIAPAVCWSRSYSRSSKHFKRQTFILHDIVRFSCFTCHLFHLYVLIYFSLFEVCGCLLIAFSTKEMAIMVFPAMAFLAAGGIAVLIANMQVSKVIRDGYSIICPQMWFKMLALYWRIWWFKSLFLRRLRAGS